MLSWCRKICIFSRKSDAICIEIFVKKKPFKTTVCLINTTTKGLNVNIDIYLFTHTFKNIYS